MVYLEPTVLSCIDHLESWLSTLEPKLASQDDVPIMPEFIRRLRDLFKVVFPAAAQCALEKCVTVIPTSDITLAYSQFKVL
jgi:hypothetical protein